MFIATLFTRDKNGISLSAHQQINESKTYINIHIGMLFGHKKNEILSFVTIWINLENIMLSEVTSAQKDKYYMTSFIVEPK
jgi:hypothetical protein